MATILLFLAGGAAGLLNSVAGGGSFVTLPTLLHVGILPVAANATSTFGVWPASVASAVAYRRDLEGTTRTALWLGGASLVGGLLGAILLVRTSDTSFMRLLPWLMLLATLTFTCAGMITARIGQSGAHEFRAWAVPLQLAISVYGGYFGGGMGIMMLATFSASGMTDIHRMNGLKSVFGVAINLVALLTFIFNGSVVWMPGLTIAAGGILGGYAGAALARRLNRDHVRWFVIAIGWLMTGYFFLR